MIKILSDPVIIAIIGLAGTIFTGAIVKFFDYRLNTVKQSFEERVHARTVRVQDIQELKEELENRKKEVRMLEESLDEWKGKYYEILEHLIELRSKLNND